MNKILLVNPRLPGLSSAYPSLSLSLLWLGSYLDQNGYEVKMINVLNQENYLNIIRKEIKDSICVGITAMTVQVSNALEISDFIKENHPDVPIIWGGTHPFLFPEQTVMDESVDVIVYDEGEYAMLELLEHFKGDKPLNKVKGIAFIDKNGEFKQTEPQRFFDMNELERVRWKLLPNIGKEYPSYVHTSRGCPYRCTFCIAVKKNRRFRFRSAEKVLKDLEDIKEMGKTEFRFRDECFFCNPKRSEKIAEGMIERNMDFEWEGSVRADLLTKYMSKELLRKIKKAGCVSFNIGAESGSQKILDMIKKDISVEDILNSARVCRDFGFKPHYSFIIGLPNETKEDMMKTLSVVDKVKYICPSSEIIMHLFRPYPGGELYEKMLSLGWKEPNTLRGWIDKSMKNAAYVTAWDIPWIEEPDFVETVSISFRWNQNILGALKSRELTPLVRVLTSGFRVISKFRQKTKFFGFPVDTRIKNVLVKYKYRL